MPLTVHGTVPSARLAELEAWVEGHTTSGAVLAAVLDTGLAVSDIVQMDEFTLDWLVALPDGLVLVYDTT